MIDLKATSTARLSSRAAFSGMIVFVLMVSATCIFDAYQFVHKPFAGFMVNWRLMIPETGQYYWTGIKAGLKFPDKILKADDRPVSSIVELETIVRSVPVGTPITYTVQRERAKVEKIVVATMRYDWADFFLTFGILFLTGIAFLLLGVIVYILKPDTKASWALLLTCFFLSIFIITGADYARLWINRANLAAFTFFPAALLHLTCVFPEDKRFLQRHGNIQFIPYLIGVLLAVPMAAAYPRPSFFIFYLTANFYLVAGALVFAGSVLHTFMRNSSPIARQRAKVVLFGASVAFPIPALIFLLNKWGVSFQNNFSVIPIFIFPASIAYAISKHNLFDVDVYLKRTVGYALITAIVSAVYLSIQVLLRPLVLQPLFGDLADKLYPGVFALLVVFFFNPVNRRVQGAVDHLFYRKQFDYRETVTAVSEALTSVLDLGEIVQRITRTLRDAMFIDTAGVLLLSSRREDCRALMVGDDPGGGPAVSRETCLPPADPLVLLVDRERKLVTEYDLAEDARFISVRETAGRRFVELGVSLVLPIVYQGRLTGILALGHKKSGHFYTREDIQLLDTLTKQGAVAIENARLFQENLVKQRMEEELAIARDLQMSMLPAECPVVEGFELAASSMPAMEVGGDFYDFFEIGPGKLGLVIGDVTGKGVSGALVMSSSRSIFRMLSEEQSSAGEIMVRANRRIKKDIKSGMFVALLYAVLQAHERTLVLCSAGQTQPIYTSPRTGETRLVETEGDTFPLGIVATADYLDTRIRLEAGDKIVFYTDGIVEAMDDRGEMFGFERLLELVRQAGDLPAGDMLKAILAGVGAFAGNAAQHDDLTVIILGAKP